MKYEKKIIAKLNKCYSIAPLCYKGQDCLLIAAEKQDPCHLFDLGGNLLETVWDAPGGTMSMVQVPGKDGQFLATHCFYSPNDSEHAKIIVASPKDEQQGQWGISELVSLPFVHRFDILSRNGVNYLIACTIKSAHSHKDDWSAPGKVYASVLPDDLSVYNSDNPLELKVIMEGLTKNHGYNRYLAQGVESAVISAEQGIYLLTPPEKSGDLWEIQHLLSEPASDALLFDLDMDGEPEIFSLTPFHGNTVRIYKKKKDAYQEIYHNNGDTEFLHAICAGIVCGKPAVITGHRKGKKELLIYTYDKASSHYCVETVDSNCGPANAYLYQWQGIDRIIATNRESDEIAIYKVSE